MTDGLVAALARCQAKFPPIVKSHTNPAFKGSQYADVADVLAAVRPVLAAEGIAVSQSTDIGEEGGVVLITAVHLGLESIRSAFPLYIGNLNAQGVGSLMTYHRRYQLCALLGVHPVGDDDDGNLAATAQAAPQRVAVLEGQTLGAPPKDWDTRALAQFTFTDLRTIAGYLGHSFSGGSKSELIRQLEPLVRAASGEEPFELEGAEPLPAKEDVTDKPFTPTVADELRNRPPAVRDSIRSGGDA